jgi:hypothetical protein
MNFIIETILILLTDCRAHVPEWIAVVTSSWLIAAGTTDRDMKVPGRAWQMIACILNGIDPGVAACRHPV